MGQRICFGNAEIRLDERVVLVGGQPAALGSRAFDMLAVLVEHRARTVSKNELLDRVWPGMVVEENNLAAQVSALRKALGPQVIATVPGRGYRFAAAVEDSPQVAPTDPPARTLGETPMPATAGELRGREQDIAALVDLVRQHRLVTIVGAGGIGKTSVAVAVARAQRGGWRDGVNFVDLTEIRDPTLVARAVAQAAGLPAVANDEPLPPLIEALKPLQMLLVVDNAEHLRDGVAILAHAVTSGVPGVHLLVTSQVPLKTDLEQVFRLGPLELPTTGASLGEAVSNGAVALFVDQARAADRRFEVTSANLPVVIDLCRQLDGVPLAIKLAAARLPLFGLAGLAARLGDRLSLLTQGARTGPRRQQTLQAALDWSHALLDDPARRVLRRLAICAGGLTLELAAAICGDESLDAWQVIDQLGELVDRSLVEADGVERVRYRLLESAREYARLRLDESGERARVQARHAEAITAMMEAAYEAYWRSADAPWLEDCAPEIDNIRAALEWSTAHDPELALRLAGSSSVVFLLTGQAPEARRRLAALESVAIQAGALPAASRYWLERSRLHLGVSGAVMAELALRAASHYRAAGDARGLYLALRCAAGSGSLPVDSATAHVAEMSALQSPDWPLRLRLQLDLARITVISAEGRLEQAREAYLDLLRQSTAAKLDSMTAVARVGLAATHLALDDPDAAIRVARTHVDAPSARRGNLILPALATIADALLHGDDVDASREAVIALIDASRIRAWEWFGLYADLFALLAVAQGRFEAAARLLGHADHAHRRAGQRDANSARARARVAAALAGALDPATLARLQDEGSRLDDEAVSELTLAT
ncbi:ATP-binding protein [Scleromatobacter humisilvae]|uniref:Helix-turn-helix transcriptional regulator n=1 Tax=Scleromatobacter humisilvae TaxID=2897159 RepID=A0A9X1YGH5_9BURK|nr:winged helix-turn-helix domain-containing protein [Scleromatobacter humisilvae]MCK9685005.1 helix-turn-helix transcriptional regulator [Scleromatobacter humisilvae]